MDKPVTWILSIKLQKKYNLIVIEDACQSFGANYQGKKSGSLSSLSAVSFFPAKPLGAYGSGGCILTTDKKIAEKIKKNTKPGTIQKICL